jgi:ubiquinone/menaquinone biosynthesis C-methylase UbiE
MSSETSRLADYGIDAPTVVRNLALGGVAALALAVVLVFVAGGAALIAFLLGVGLLAAAAAMVLSSRILKLRERDRILAAIPWRGDERVLDVGCGRGLMLIGAAHHLATGKAVGVDVWSARDQTGNRPAATRTNARIEGVGDRVEVLDADARELPFEDASFDVVLSSIVVHNIPTHAGRVAAIREITRVLKPGGRVAILDIWNTRTYARLFSDLGLANVRRSGPRFLFSSARLVTASKPGRPAAAYSEPGQADAA